MSQPNKLKQTRWTPEQLARIKLAALDLGITSDGLIRIGTMEKVQENERQRWGVKSAEQRPEGVYPGQGFRLLSIGEIRPEGYQWLHNGAWVDGECPGQAVHELSPVFRVKIDQTGGKA